MGALVVGVVGLSSACGSSSSTPPCEEGEIEACSCATGAGARICGADGTYGECQCLLADAAPVDAPAQDGGAGPIPDASSPVDASPIPAEGSFHHFVSNTVVVPQDNQQAVALGLDLDGDPQARPDDALGGILTALRQLGLDVQTATTDAVSGGRVLLLHSLQATDLASADHAGWGVYLGAGAPPPLFDGNDAFTLDPGAVLEPPMLGTIVGGHFEGGPGTTTILVAFTAGPPIPLHLVGARVRADVAADGCANGVLGGAMTESEVDTQLVPGLQELFNRSVQDDGPDGQAPVACPSGGAACPASMSGDATSCVVAYDRCLTQTSKTLLDLFDVDHNLDVTVDEVRNATLIKALLAPDVDLFDATGAFNPRVDGRADSLSMGIGFTCTSAAFAVPGE